MKPILGIGLGDAAGIGPELVAKMCAAKSFHKYCTPVIIKDTRVLASGMRIANANFDFITIQDQSSLPADPEGIYLLNLKTTDADTVKTGELNGASGKAAIAGIFRGLDLCRQGQIALKLNNFSEGVTVAGGFPYAITTPAHSTAFDIAGRGIANPHAFELAVKIASEMRNWKETSTRST